MKTKTKQQFDVMGTVTLPVELKVKSDSKEGAIKEADTNINPYNIESVELVVKTPSGVHKLKVNDIEAFDWESVFGEDE
jgi:hypothetical protein